MYLGDTGLLPGERMIWEGAPKRISMLAKSDLMIVPGLLFFGAWFYFFTRDGDEFPVILYLVAAFVLMGWIWQPVQRYLKLKSTSYAVTDQRVVVWVKGKESTSGYLEMLGPPQVAENGDGTGTVTFGKGVGFVVGLFQNADDAMPELSGIEDARRVRDLIATAQQKAR
ncbi:hypothetical protein [Amycolatopsis keratiniphila]|uniref:DUF304 domain-containing protein n=1 Tax=Amycolatopsis keratiniphila subsp. keratiniphila TaxID=227715 RepID=A0A1W2LT06_9PSEU|nr:hypothetical protein [Amycolatopsis keratiniphila]OLZ44800.1 hypothetical protein BS330_39875 [Amycolatopsis keratiniphila subsp. nogabecina]ONF68002.1 hypothetical protein AVR91_0221450 [Amycolatopsis keratiniphila subsp. keratiniphila]SDU67709.1 hypothetical protein SAMN04489733_8173 [Amycolatopsis keratiniphila]